MVRRWRPRADRIRHWPSRRAWTAAAERASSSPRVPKTLQGLCSRPDRTVGPPISSPAASPVECAQFAVRRTPRVRNPSDRAGDQRCPAVAQAPARSTRRGLRRTDRCGRPVATSRQGIHRPRRSRPARRRRWPSSTATCGRFCACPGTR
jgi:hypothetical protein